MKKGHKLFQEGISKNMIIKSLIWTAEQKLRKIVTVVSSLNVDYKSG